MSLECDLDPTASFQTLSGNGRGATIMNTPGIAHILANGDIEIDQIVEGMSVADVAMIFEGDTSLVINEATAADSDEDADLAAMLEEYNLI